MSAFIIDTEGTGLHEPDVIEIAHVRVPNLDPAQDMGPVVVERFHPRKPITAAAMAVHNIIQEDLVNSPTWPGAWIPPEGLDGGPHYLIGHGIDYDYKAIGSPPGVNLICTLALARFLYDECESHKLGAMIYHLIPPDHARRYVAGAHGAAADVGMAWLLLGFLLDKAQELKLLPGVVSFDDLWKLSEQARIPLRMTFGKYGPKDGGRGQLYSEVATQDPGYLKWVLRQGDFDPYVIQASEIALSSRS